MVRAELVRRGQAVVIIGITYRLDKTTLPLHRLSPSESRRPSVKGKARQVSLHRSQPVKPVKPLGKSSRTVTTPEPAKAQMSPRALEQARRVLHVIVASAHSREHAASGSTFSISSAAMLDLLASEFNDHNPEAMVATTCNHNNKAVAR